MNLDKFTKEELEAELRRRNKNQRDADKPQQIDDPSLTNLRSMCQKYIDHISERDPIDDDLKHYIFEAALEALFGADVWDFVNSRAR